ncbi:uncharacterized protein LOC108042764 [Drosophila rhopaloa]|uniref:Enkurin domain-containing protein n=1 Tax=Drosophila rhopaloa TaxID=1041015 RepID=A0ABM5H9C2_DRORH|nr:uncharacterized protein LOC108042764 [Drosophila rhopaloa]
MTRLPMGGIQAINPSRRNFLRENRMMVSQVAPSYQMPTAASLARCCGPVKQLLADGTRPKRVPDRRNLSEKQVQTEDINDERFLSAALLKCSEKTQFQLQSHSEGDETVIGRGNELLDEGPCLRRTASNFELGRVPEQRDCYRPGQYTLHRPLATLLGIVPGGLNYLDSGCSSIRQQDDEVFQCCPSSRPSSPRVRQMDIPEVVDVDPEDMLSVRSQASCEHLPVLDAQIQEDEFQKLPDPLPESHKEPESQHILLSSDQRRVLLDAARERQNKLIAEYNRLPLSMGTLRVRNLKQKLEQQLDLVDYDLNMLSQAKVFLKQEPESGVIAH